MSNDKYVESPEELQNPKLATIPVDTEELEIEEKIMEGVEDVLDISEDDLNKKNYVKISPTFYIQPLFGEENKDVFKILNPETGSVEIRELTDEEKHDVFVRELKESRKRYKPTSHPIKVVSINVTKNELGRVQKERIREVQSNVTVAKFDSAYKQKRKRRNKLAKASRKANRK